MMEKNPKSIISALLDEKNCDWDACHEKYILDWENFDAENNSIKEINKIIPKTRDKMFNILKNKIKENFSWLDEKYYHLVSMVFWDLEHSYWWNRLFIKSKIVSAIDEWKPFSYASYDINWMSFSNKISKILWNLRIHELSYISHEIVKYLKNLWYNETFFSRNWWDEFSLFTTAPNNILRQAFEYWKQKTTWHLEEILDKETFQQLLIEARNTKWWKTKEEVLSKITWFTVWINSYNFNFNWLKADNLEEKYKNIATSTDELMEHYKSWRLEKKYKEKILDNIKDLKNKDKIKEIINSLSLEEDNQEKIEEIKKINLDKNIEEKIIFNIQELFQWWYQIITQWPKTSKQNAIESINFVESNELSNKQNDNFHKIWKNLENEIKEQFNKITKKRNKIIENFWLNEDKIARLDFLLWKAKFREKEINEIKEIVNISNEEIQELKVEYLKALFTRWHYTWSYQSQVDKVIRDHSETRFNFKNKTVINIPSFKSINELSWHTNWDYFIMNTIYLLKKTMFQILQNHWIDKKLFWKSVIIASKWPNTEIFLNESYVKNIDEIFTEFKEKISNSDFLEKFNEKIWKDEEWKTLLDKRIEFIKKYQPNKIIDIKKEILLIKMWKNLQDYEEVNYKNIFNEYIQNFEYNDEKIEKEVDEILRKKINTFEILK